jgi:hypothetical protein
MDLDEKSWRVVLKGISLLSGLAIQDDHTIARARRPGTLTQLQLREYIYD